MADKAGGLGGRLRQGARAVREMTGWRRAAAGFAAGICGALAMAPVYALFLLPVSFTLLILLIDGAAAGARPRRRAFAAGWFWGFGYFLAGVYWMAFSFFVQADQFAWMAPFAVTAMPAFLALFPAAAAAFAVQFWRPGWRRVFAFAVAFSVFEYLRGHVLTGLPWNLAGQSLAGAAVASQTAAWWGAYGLSLVAILLSGAPAAGLSEGASSRRAAFGFLTALVGTLLLFGVGFVRLLDAPITPVAPDAYVRIVQPNIAQRDKIDPQKWGENFYRQLELSKGDGLARAPEQTPLFIIWPENGAPLLDEAQSALDILAQELPQGSTLIAGAVRREDGADGADRYFNSIAILPHSADGRRVEAVYDKHHLVPFGEYLPFYDFLNAVGLAQLTPYGDAGFAAGDGPKTLSVNGQPFAPLVCYEAIFPGAVYPKDDRPRWLVTVTNDAWFGDTSGPRQHLDQARLRSIESGLPMARSANTGVSALIDAKGRIIERVKLYEAGQIDAPLPPALPPTLYHHVGDRFYFLMLAGFAALAAWGHILARAARGGLQPLRDRVKR